MLLAFHDTSEFCWLMWGERGKCSVAEATWENKSVSHIICQSPLLTAERVLIMQPQSCPSFGMTFALVVCPSRSCQLLRFSSCILAQAGSSTPKKAHFEWVLPSLLLNSEGTCFIPSQCCLQKPLQNRKLVTVLVDRCHPVPPNHFVCFSC